MADEFGLKPTATDSTTPRHVPSAFGVAPVKPAVVEGEKSWTPIGRDSPASKAALAEREAAKWKASKANDAKNGKGK